MADCGLHPARSAPQWVKTRVRKDDFRYCATEPPSPIVRPTHRQRVPLRRQFRVPARKTVVAAALAAAVTTGLVTTVSQGAAQAYCINDGITKWEGNNRDWAHSPNYPTTWWSTLNSSVLKWSDLPGSYLHYNGTNVTDNWRNFGFRSARYDFSNSGLSDSPGFTSNIYEAGTTHSWSGVDFNLDWGFNTSGVMSSVNHNVDLATIAVHEIGHASGVAHPFVANVPTHPCGTTPSPGESEAVMNGNFTVKRQLAPDDIDAMQVRY